jgi:hypothetical protein
MSAMCTQKDRLLRASLLVWSVSEEIPSKTLLR